MRDDGRPVDQVLQAVQEAYAGLLWSVPLVLAGIVLTGSAFYFAFVRPQTRGRGWKAWLGYLFPRDMYTTRSAKVDINVWLLNGLIFIPVFEACVIITGLVAGVSFNELFAGWFGPAATLTSQVWLIVAIQFLGFWFGQGIGQYSGHLAMHKVPALWALHRAHHSAESANLFTFLRSHPLEHFINGATRVIGTAAGLGIALYITASQLLPETTATIFWYNIAYVLIGFRSVDHLHIPVSYGRVLDVLVGSPIMHQVHHSAEAKHRDVNMAGAGYLFDWVFGTLYIPERGERWRWGLNDDELGEANPHNSLKGFFIEPLTTMWAETRRLFAQPGRTPGRQERTLEN
jgi:sterol desaturase/sphingolipid hydroxylase (fatty acid hydroxylase superfamily)